MGVGSGVSVGGWWGGALHERCRQQPLERFVGTFSAPTDRERGKTKQQPSGLTQKHTSETRTNTPHAHIQLQRASQGTWANTHAKDAGVSPASQQPRLADETVPPQAPGRNQDDFAHQVRRAVAHVSGHVAACPGGGGKQPLHTQAHKHTQAGTRTSETTRRYARLQKTSPRTCTHNSTHMRTPAQAHGQAHTRARPHKRTGSTHMRTHRHARAHTPTHSQVRVRTHQRTCRHACAHTDAGATPVSWAVNAP